MKIFMLEQVARKFHRKFDKATIFVGRGDDYLWVQIGFKTFEYSFSRIAEKLNVDEVKLGHISYYSPITKKEETKPVIVSFSH